MVKKMGLILSMVVILVASMNTGHAESASISFKDVPRSHWGSAYINNAISSGYVQGFSDGTFKPDEQVTREQFIAMLVKALKLPLSSESGGTWFSPYYKSAVANKLYVNDYKGDLDQPITRGEMAVTLVRATQQYAYEQQIKEEFAHRFSDDYLEKRYEKLDYFYLQQKKILSVDAFHGDLNDIAHPVELINNLQKAIDSLTPQIAKENTWICPPGGLVYKDLYVDCFDLSSVKSGMTDYKNFIQLGIDIVDLASSKQVETPGRMVYEAVNRSLLTGTGIGELSLDLPSTRAQATVVIERALAFNSGKDLPVPDRNILSAAEIHWHKTNIFTMLPGLFSNYTESIEVPNRSYYVNTSAIDDFDSKKMVAEADNGNVRCETEKLVVVDLDDPNDPNRNLVPTDALVFYEDYSDIENTPGGTILEKPLPKTGYVILSLNHLVVKSRPDWLTSFMSCHTDLNGDHLQKPNAADSEVASLGTLTKTETVYAKDTLFGKPNDKYYGRGNKYGFVLFYAVSDAGISFISDLNAFETRYMNGMYLPKGQLQVINPPRFHINSRKYDPVEPNAIFGIHFSGLADYGVQGGPLIDYNNNHYKTGTMIDVGAKNTKPSTNKTNK